MIHVSQFPEAHLGMNIMGEGTFTGHSATMVQILAGAP